MGVCGKWVCVCVVSGCGKWCGGEESARRNTHRQGETETKSRAAWGKGVKASTHGCAHTHTHTHIQTNGCTVYLLALHMKDEDVIVCWWPQWKGTKPQKQMVTFSDELNECVKGELRVCERLFAGLQGSVCDVKVHMLLPSQLAHVHTHAYTYTYAQSKATNQSTIRAPL